MWIGERLIIPRKVARAMVTTAVKYQPTEVCGVLVGWGGVNAQYWIPIPNIHSDPEHHYQMDPESQIRAWDWAEKHDLKVIAIVHSHVNTDAVLSMGDIDYAAHGEMFYVILSLKEPRDLRAWTIERVPPEPGAEITPHKVVVDQGKDGLWYCWSHNKYEDSLRAFRVCFECGHSYATELDLIGAHNDEIAGMMDAEDNPDFKRDFEANKVDSADQLDYCPYCSHSW